MSFRRRYIASLRAASTFYIPLILQHFAKSRWFANGIRYDGAMPRPHCVIFNEDCAMCKYIDLPETKLPISYVKSTQQCICPLLIHVLKLCVDWQFSNTHMQQLVLVEDHSIISGHFVNMRVIFPQIWIHIITVKHSTPYLCNVKLYTVKTVPLYNGLSLWPNSI